MCMRTSLYIQEHRGQGTRTPSSRYPSAKGPQGVLRRSREVPSGPGSMRVPRGSPRGPRNPGHLIGVLCMGASGSFGSLKTKKSI